MIFDILPSESWASSSPTLQVEWTNLLVLSWKSPWIEFGPEVHSLALSSHPEQAEPGGVVGLLAPGLNSSNQLEAASKVEFVPDQLEPVLHLDQVLQVDPVLHLEHVHLVVPVLQHQLDPKHHFEPVHQFGLELEMAGMVLHCLKSPMVSWTS